MPLKLAVEVDGPTHSAERDSIRDSHLENLGVTILHFSHQEIDENLEGVVNTIHQTVRYLQNQSR